MKIALGSDHGGYRLKEEIKKFLEAEKLEYTDYGTCTTESVDYPDFAEKVAQAVVEGESIKGIIICGTGIGISIAANKVPGIRCALCHDTFSARATRQHNDSNILALGERVIGVGLAMDIVKVWLTTEFEGGRHSIRVAKITELEKKYK
jgi:ribose 5-phosphate isomerase B